MTMHSQEPLGARACLRDPIPELADAARYLDAAVSAHLAGRPDLAEGLIHLADMPAIREWTESIWGRNSAYVQYRVVSGSQPSPSRENRVKVRMPTFAEKHNLLLRDGYHCR